MYALIFVSMLSMFPSAFAEQATPAAKIGAAVVVLRPWGFEPTELKVNTGKFLLVVFNRSGKGEVSLRLDRDAGGRLHEVRLPSGRSAWRQVVELTPGRYVISEASNPKWIGKITIY
jgi:hypothetical protein